MAVNRRVFFPFLGVCAAVGYFGYGATFGKVNRVETLVNLFETYCVPLGRGQPLPSLEKLTEVNTPPGARMYLDPGSLTGVSFAENACWVSDLLQPMNDLEQAQFDNWVETNIPRIFPALKFDPRSTVENSEKFVVWAEYPAFDRRRWGVRLVRAGHPIDAGVTRLTVMLPRKI